MRNNKSGQMVISLLFLVMAFIIFVLAAPILSEIILESFPGMGTATAFVVKLFPWFILLILIFYFFKIISSGEGFFVG